MKLYYLSIVLLFFQGGYHEFISLFLKVKYDEYGNYLTRGLNSKDYSDLPNDYTLIADDYSFVYLCDRDSSKFEYEYGLYDMDEDRDLGVVSERYKHYAVARIANPNFDVVLFSKFDSDNERFFIRSFNKKGYLIDELKVNEEVRTGTGASLDKFTSSLISPDSIKVFNYDDVENPNREDIKTPLVTKVVIENYALDSLGRFNKVGVDSTILSKPMRVYTKFNNEPEPDDPVYKYWTLY